MERRQEATAQVTVTPEEFLLLQKKEAQAKFVDFLKTDLDNKMKILTSISEAINLIDATKDETSEVIVTLGFTVIKYEKTGKLLGYLREKEKTTETMLEQRRQKHKLAKELLDRYENEFNAVMKKKLSPGGRQNATRTAAQKPVHAR